MATSRSSKFWLCCACLAGMSSVAFALPLAGGSQGANITLASASDSLGAAAKGAAKPVGKGRYSVRIALPPPEPLVALPKIAGPQDDRRPLVVIDPGHGGHDPGAISPHGGAREKNITLGVARAIRDAILKEGRFRVALTRDDDRFLALQERYGIAQRLGADLFISVHADSAHINDASGATIYTLSEVASDREASRLAARENKADILNGIDLADKSPDVSSILIDLTQRETMMRSSDFAQLLHREGAQRMPFRSESHRFASFVVLKAPDVPSILLEAGYLTNARDVGLLSSREGRQAVGGSVADAIKVFFARQMASRSTSQSSPLGGDD